MLAARRSVDDENARFLARVVMPLLRRQDRLARGEPIDRDLVTRIGKSLSGLAGERRLA